MTTAMAAAHDHVARRRLSRSFTLASGAGSRPSRESVKMPREAAAAEADAHGEDVEDDGQLDEHRQPMPDVLLGHRAEVGRDRRSAAAADRPSTG